MSTVTFAKSVSALLKGAKSLLVVAPHKALAAKAWPRLLPKRLDALVCELASGISPGDLGAVDGTLTGLGEAGPRKLQVGALPDRVSRYNSPSRAEAIRKVVDAAGLARRGKVAVLLVLDGPEHVAAAVNAVSRALPSFSAKSEGAPARKVSVLCVERSGEILTVDKYASLLVAASREAANQVDTPPADLDPAAFAARARTVLADLDVEITEFIDDHLLSAGLRGIHTVGRAAMSSPRMLVARWRPRRPSGRHYALVGKGITFDTGGLHIKARGAMETMKCDMGGAAACLGAFRVLVGMECPHALSLVLCIAENAVGPDSYRPDDILTLHSGRTVEINNTDAEGRLLLADGVSYAARVLEADTILDAATLTGAQLMASGRLHAAVISNDADLERAAIDASYASGDLAHPLPFAPEFFRQEFASKVADMKNSVRDRNNAPTSAAAQFVYSHIADTEVRWCHVDLAGPAFQAGRGTGFGVALLAATVMADVAAAE